MFCLSGRQAHDCLTTMRMRHGLTMRSCWIVQWQATPSPSHIAAHAASLAVHRGPSRPDLLRSFQAIPRDCQCVSSRVMMKSNNSTQFQQVRHFMPMVICALCSSSLITDAHAKATTREPSFDHKGQRIHSALATSLPTSSS